MSELLTELQRHLTDRYEIVREIGSGGMATVFLAQDRRLDRRVAIKVMHPQVSSCCATERFLREVRITAQLQHPNILPLIDSGEAGELLFSVMPFVPGESLRERLQTAGRLPLKEALTIAREIGSALDYAHRQGVIHRDIKPENILLSDGHAIIADFGIARAVDIAGGPNLTASGLPLGTATYMSPEQASGEGEVDGRSDTYSLGLVLYEMLAGQMAFRGPSIRTILAQQVSADPPPLSAIRPDVPPAVVDTVVRAIAKNPADRFQTAGEMVERLVPCLEALPGGAPGTARRERPQTGRVGWRGLVPHTAGGWLVTGALLSSVALAVILWGPEPRRAQAQEDPGYAASVAVLPFKNYGGPEDEYFSDGITEEIISQLAQVESLKVISRTSVVALKDSRLTVPQIAETLGVRHVLEGSVRRMGPRVRVTVQLIEARTDAHLWADSYDAELAEGLQLQDAIARRVSEALLRSIRPMRGQSAVGPMPDAGVYDALLRGRFALQQRTPEGLRAALTAFEEAAGGDSNYAPGLAGAASAGVLLVIYGFPGDHDRYALTAKSLLRAERAVALDPQLAAGHQARADALALFHAAPEGVLASAQHAAQLAPNSADAAIGLAHALARAGRHGEAMAQAARAIELDPLSLGVRHSAITIALAARRYDAALGEVVRVRALDPTSPVIQRLEAYTRLLMGQPDPCVGLAERRPICLVTRDVPGAKALADSTERALLERGAPFDHDYAEEAIYYAWRGDVAGTLAWLERSIAVTPVLHYWEFSAGLFDRVRNDPAFRAGLLRLQQEARMRLMQERRRLEAEAIAPSPTV